MRLWLSICIATCVSCKPPPPAPDAAPLASASAAPTATTPATAPSLAAGCAEYASAMCAAFVRCNPNVVPVTWADVRDCERALTRECRLTNELPSVNVTTDALHRCAVAVATKSCPVDREEPECQPPPGKLAGGAACIDGSQCAGGACKRKSLTDACGTCALAEHANPSSAMLLGGRCKQDDDCAEGLFCKQQRCRVAVVRHAGESCTPGLLGFPVGAQQCASGLDCVESRGGARCEVRPNDGEACRRDGPRCPFPSRCLAGKCTPPVSSCP